MGGEASCLKDRETFGTLHAPGRLQSAEDTVM